MTKIYYVRHAEPNYTNHDDRLRELTDKGLRDSQKVTVFLQDKEVTVAVSSPFKRAYDTIKDFTDRFGLEIEMIEDFRERKIDSVWVDDFTTFPKNSGRIFPISYPMENACKKYKIEMLQLSKS